MRDAAVEHDCKFVHRDRLLIILLQIARSQFYRIGLASCCLLFGEHPHQFEHELIECSLHLQLVNWQRMLPILDHVGKMALQQRCRGQRADVSNIERLPLRIQAMYVLAAGIRSKRGFVQNQIIGKPFPIRLDYKPRPFTAVQQMMPLHLVSIGFRTDSSLPASHIHEAACR
ncbi:hypothetical protein D3C73_923730 [compost metagenome]